MFAKSPKLFLITFICCLPLVAAACAPDTTSVPTATPPPPSPVPTTAVPPTVAPPTDVPPIPTSIVSSTEIPTQEKKPTSTPQPRHILSITNRYDGVGVMRGVILTMNSSTLAATSYEYLQSEEYSLPGARYKLMLQLLIDGTVSETKTYLFTLDADTEVLINNMNDVEIN